MSDLPAPFRADAAVFTVTIAARLAGMHPQTLRQYDRLGLVVPKRTRGRGRRYSLNDVKRLRLVQHLSQSEGVNLQGIQHILAMEDELAQLRARIAELEETVLGLHAAARGPRVFTADSFGAVNLGLHTRRTRALPPGS